MQAGKRLAVVAAMLLVLGACSSGGSEVASPTGPKSKGSPGADASGAPSPGGTASPNLADQAGNPIAMPTPGVVMDPSRPCDGARYFSPYAGVPGGTYIRAEARPPGRWGCGSALNPGDRCDVWWDGAYSIKVGEQVYLRFQAFAKGQAKPFKEITAGPLPPENSFQRTMFPITIPKAQEIAVQVLLLDGAKVPVALSDGFSFPVNCPHGAN